ncbi:MAG: prepilin-type N-terminal cleavage/methylation domain-containing protein, partial [Phycisphaerae bacterium]|nr:prepilin-type N-terminal cleavage/methylation domain-containing protein [Phycisphaerae bacterium]
MNSKSVKKGFTLIEILVAVAIIVTIVSMVYGSYFATSKSAQACRKRIALSQQGRELLGRMARQIRCSYAGSFKKSTPPAPKGSLKNEETQENIINYFAGNSGQMGGEILYLVTTNGNLDKQAPGLFEVTYKFDKNTGTLLLSQERFVDGPKSFIEHRNWQTLAENIESIELAFSDGRQWLNTWDFKEKKVLPYAVKINITCQDENYRQYSYGTTEYICCRKNQGNKTTSAGL